MAFVRFLGKVSKFLAVVSEYLSSLFMIAVIVILFAQVLMRTFLSTNFPWAEEIARVCMLWVAMLGGSLLVKENDLISVDFLDPILPPILLKYRPIVITILLVWLCAILAYEGYHQAVFGWNATLSSVHMRMFWPYLSIPVGAALMLFHYFVNTCEKFAGIGGDTLS